MLSTYVSLAIIGIVVVFWLFLLWRLTFYRIVKQKAAQKALERGMPIDGTILSAQEFGSGKLRRTKITVEFLNFSKSPITEDFIFVDTKPEQRRYEVGKRIRLVLNSEAKNGKPVSLAEGKLVTGNLFLFISSALFFGYLYGAYQLYLFCDNIVGGDWNNADRLFQNNPTMPLLGLIFIGTLLFQYLIFSLVFNLFKSKKGISDFELKYHGIKTTATILRYEGTNITINQNPVVRFYYTYNDRSGRPHQDKDQVAIGRLEIGNLSGITEKDIMYLPHSPEKSKLVENLKPVLIEGCMKGIFLFIAFVFSVVIITLFITML